MTEEIAFADWSKKLERSGNSNDLTDESNAEQGTNSWLPAYGFYQPSTAIHPTLLQNKNLEFYSNEMGEANCSSNLLLETIMEETSDDLRSETSESEYNSGLLTDSVSTVIHVSSYREGHKYRRDREAYWNSKKDHEINTDPGVQDDDDEDDDDEDDFTDEDEDQSSESEDESDGDVERISLNDQFPSSRTNSLLQFENLEKHYETIFRSQRNLPSENGALDSSNSYSNRNSRLWQFRSTSQPENLNNSRDIDDDNDSSSISSSCSSSSSEMVSSDEILSSSYSSMRHDSLTAKQSLRSSRSMDSLTSLHQKCDKDQSLLHSCELSQSLNEGISKLDEHKDDIPAPARSIYKTMECLSEFSDKATYKDDSAVILKKEDVAGVDEPDRVEPRRSAENLSEDSGFGDHVTARTGNQEDLSATNRGPNASSMSVKTDTTSILTPNTTIIDTNTSPSVSVLTASTAVISGNNFNAKHNGERVKIENATECERSEETAVSKFSSNVWQTDSEPLDRTYVIRDDDENDVETNAHNENKCISETIRDINRQKIEDSSSVAMASRMAVASTPNLYNITDEEYNYKGNKNGTETTLSSCNDSTVSLSRIYSLKRINFENESKFSCCSSKGSNIQIMTSFVNLTNPHNDANRGVHFCPVVSEVSWQDSCSSTSEVSFDRLTNNSAADDDESYDSPSREENYERDRESTPHIDELVEKLLSETVSTKRSGFRDKENREQQQRIQNTRLDLITSPPPDLYGSGSSNSSCSGGNHVMLGGVSESDVNNSWSQFTSTTASSQCSAAFRDASNANMISDTSVGDSNFAGAANKNKSKSSVGKLGGFFQRFSLKRLSGRKSKNKKSAPPVVVGCVPKNSYAAGCDDEGSNSRVVSLSEDGKETPSMVVTSNEMVSRKPPLPPFAAPARRRPSAGEHADPAPPLSFAHSAAVEHQYSRQRDGSSDPSTMLRKTPYIDPNTGIGLLETDIDSNVTLAQNANANDNGNNCSNEGNSPSNKKSRSLLNLDNGRMSTKQLTPTSNRTKNTSSHHTCNDYRAKSMEFLLDKENQAAVQAPENELQKGNGERKMSEHELRVQRSLQKLNVPEWYRNSSVPAQGFLLKRHSDAGQNQQTHHRWNASTLPSKTTSLSSLGSNLSTTPRSPTSTITSPGPSHYSFSRWSTSRLNSGANSTSTSPCGSARSSFNYRQPYLGWRSQERLSKPRTPAERLAAGLLPQNNQIGSQQSSPSLNEVRSSIKEVTSAIVHYVSGTRDSSDRLSPSLRHYTDNSSKSASPRGSTGRLCWVESSFVGTRPSNNSDAPSKLSYSRQPAMANKASEDDSYQRTNAVQKSCCENQGYNNRMNGEYLLA